MVTVPAHNFCAPTRAKLIAALRSIPGVDGTLGSSWSPGMTRTPSCFQRSWSCECVPVMMYLFDKSLPLNGTENLVHKPDGRGTFDPAATCLAEAYHPTRRVPWVA